MEEERLASVILQQLQLKYSRLNEILNITKDIGESLSRNDRVSVQILLESRQNEMSRVDECDKAIAILTEALSKEERQKIDLKENLEEQKIAEIRRNIKMVLERVMLLDKGMSRRVAGKESFYSD